MSSCRRSTNSTSQVASSDSSAEPEAPMSEAGSVCSSIVSTDIPEVASRPHVPSKGNSQWSAMTPVDEDDTPHKRLQQASMAAGARRESQKSQSSRQSAVSSRCSTQSGDSCKTMPLLSGLRASQILSDYVMSSEGWNSMAQRWRSFTLFGIRRDDSLTTRVWGATVSSNRDQRRESLDSSTETCKKFQKQKRRGSTALGHMVRTHTYHDEMRLQLRDERISMSYLDAFGTDVDPIGSRLIRVFSVGANLLEYLKITLALWTFFWALSIASFLEALHPLDKRQGLLCTDLLVDIVYIGCLCMQLRTTILDVETGCEFCIPRKIIHAHLLDVKFWLDIVSCMPLICLQQASGTRARFALVKALRGWRIGRMPPQHSFVPSTAFLLFRLTMAIFMGGHLFACVWFTIIFEKEKTMMHYVPSNLRDDDMYFPQANRYETCVSSPSGCFWELYAVSFKYGIYLLMGIDLEAYSPLANLFVALSAPLGGLVHAYVLGKIILLIQRQGALGTKQNEHTLAIQEAMRILCLPPNLQMRIMAYFTYERIHRSGRLFSTLFKNLSPQLRFELSLHLYLDLVRKSGLFRKTRPRVIRDIVMNLEDVIFMPGDWICRYGDYGDSMYFIVTGKCAVIDRDTVTELKYLERGAYFGEVALLTGVPRTAYVRANTFCIMAQLTKDGFAPIVRKWPEEIDVLISGIDNLLDRQKIKNEASKHYGLRRMSRISTTPAETIISAQDPYYSGKTSCRSSMMVLSDSPVPPMSMASTPSLLERMRVHSEGIENGSRLRHSLSGPIVRSSLRKGIQDVSTRTGMEDDTLSTRKTSFAASSTQSSMTPWTLQPEPLTAMGETFQLSREPKLKRRLTSPAFCSQAEAAEASDAAESKRTTFEVTSPPGSESGNPSHSRPPISSPSVASDNEQKCGSQDSDSSCGFQAKVASTDSTAAQGSAFAQIQVQLNDVVRNMADLQDEVMKQRSDLMDNWDSMRQWTVEAVREVVSREVGNFHSSRRSSRSDDFFGSLPDMDTDDPGGINTISTPFT